MAEYIELFNSIDPSIIKSIGSQATDFLTKKGQDFLAGQSQQTIQEASNNFQSVIAQSPVLSDTFATIGTLNNIKYIATIFLVLWSILLMITEFSSLFTPKQSDDIKYLNKIAFGDLGIIPMIFILWVLVLSITIIIPALINVTPKFSDLLSNVNKAISVFLTSGLK